MGSRRGRGRPRHDDILTPTEWQVVHAAQHGRTNQAIAAARGVSVDAVKFHVANALAKLGVANKRALRGWFRAPRDSALGRREDGMSESLELGAIGQVSRSVSDLDASKVFYEELLGLRHLYSFPGMAFFDLGGTRLFLTEASELPEGESVLYLRVSDIAGAYEELQGRGLVFTHAPHLIHRHEDGTEEWMAFFEDPDGRALAIMEQVKG
jgi:DNA-binding CsgD family transcriptional regulator/catechol 2,3-dioxygenase-like lactoylglutathione lyase family enzyme